MKRACRFFISSTIWMLILTSCAKLFSSFGASKVLDIPDGLLPISVRQTLVVVGAIEFAVVLVLWKARSTFTKLAFICWLGLNFMLYRLFMVLLTVGKPCPCLGSITDRLHISAAAANRVLAAVAWYLLLGSLFFLSTRAWQDRRGNPVGLPQ